MYIIGLPISVDLPTASSTASRPLIFLMKRLRPIFACLIYQRKARVIMMAMISEFVLDVLNQDAPDFTGPDVSDMYIVSFVPRSNA